MRARSGSKALAFVALLAMVAGCGRAADVAAAPASAAPPAPPPRASAVATSALDPRAELGAEQGAPPPRGPLLSTSRLTSWVYEKASFDALHAGYLRAGTRVVRAAEKGKDASGRCAWVAIEPAGYVCDGAEGVTSNLDDPGVRAASAWRPDTSAPLPYPAYGTSLGAPVYARIPTAAELRSREGDAAKHEAAYQDFLARFDPAKRPPALGVPLSEVPFFLRDGGAAPNLLGPALPKGAGFVAWSWPGMRLAFQAAFEHEGRAFYYTTEGWVVPANDFRVARVAEFHGVELARAGERGERLTIIYATREEARVLTLSDDGKALVPVGDDFVLPPQGHLEVVAEDARLFGALYHELRVVPDGLARRLGDAASKGQRFFVRRDEVVRVDAASKRPADAAADEAWIEVNIAKQTMVFYRGLEPIYATLVSTGIGYVDDPTTSHATPRGTYRVFSKHVSIKMSADEKPPKDEGGQPERAYRIDDVPWVQYFEGGYAFHTAFWHDDFGQPRSHGCVNLSPRDALWLFEHTEPQVPSGWHGVYAGRAGAGRGTLIVIRAGYDAASVAPTQPKPPPPAEAVPAD